MLERPSPAPKNLTGDEIPMTSSTLPLDQVVQRIRKQEAELRALRQEYADRQQQLDGLQRQRQDLQARLDQVEGQIQALRQGSGASAPIQEPTAKPAASENGKARKAPAAGGKKPGFSAFLVRVVRQAGRPLTNKELAEAVRRRKFPTKTSDLAKQVATRVGDLIKKGHLRRTPDGTAVTLPEGGNGKPDAQAKAQSKQKPAPAAAQAKGTAAAKRGDKQPSLKSVLTKLLGKADRPLSGGELARQAQAAGYRSKSRNFPNVVWVMLRSMDGVEHVKGQGYRLQKLTTSRKG
jgi:hypothetical protein